MHIRDRLKEQIFDCSPRQFESLALDVFRYQARHNQVYAEFLRLLQWPPEEVNELTKIPFLPISLFKTHKVVTGACQKSIFFESSGTTSEQNSRHYVCDPSIYHRSIEEGFRGHFGNIHNYCFFALLPSYLERKHASLVYMCDYLLKQSQVQGGGFFLRDYKGLAERLQAAEAANQASILFGVTFALMDFAEQYPRPLPHTTIIETGGMKGRRDEITRDELHAFLSKQFPGAILGSEYGMTELLSQAYSRGKRFSCPPWMKIQIREINDPLHSGLYNERGAINVIDLANLDSCSFIATSDLGIAYRDGTFEVLGRLDYSDIRGCNLLVS